MVLLLSEQCILMSYYHLLPEGIFLLVALEANNGSEGDNPERDPVLDSIFCFQGGCIRKATKLF